MENRQLSNKADTVLNMSNFIAAYLFLEVLFIPNTLHGILTSIFRLPNYVATNP
jgi:hypothetical protein